MRFCSAFVCMFFFLIFLACLDQYRCQYFHTWCFQGIHLNGTGSPYDPSHRAPASDPRRTSADAAILHVQHPGRSAFAADVLDHVQKVCHWKKEINDYA